MYRPELVLEVNNNTTSIVSGKLFKEEYKEFKKALGYKLENYQWIIRQKIAAAPAFKKEQVQKMMEQWDGYKTTVCYSKGHCSCAVKKDYTHFPTGLLNNARNVFKKYKIPYRLVDIRSPVLKDSSILGISDEYQLRDYQIKVRDDACNQTRGLIKIATGGGKTIVAASMIVELGVFPTVFYVTSCDLLTQAKEEFEKVITKNGLPIEVGQIGGGKKEIKDITIMTVQTAVKCLGGVYKKFDEEDKDKDETEVDDIKEKIIELIHSAKCIICDEVQHWASETAQIISDNSFSAYFKYGASATPYRDMGDDILIDACFGKTIADIDATFLIERDFLVRPEIYFVHMRNIKSTYSSYQKIYKHALKENALRNKWISDLSNRFLSEGKLPLVLINHIDHGNAIQSLIPDSVFLHGSKTNKVRKLHLDKMRKRECGVTISSSIFDEGVDVKALDTLVLAGSGKSPTRALQRIGRVIRPYTFADGTEKTEAIVVDFYDHVKYLSDHAKSRRKIYEREKAFIIKDIEIE